MFHIESTPGYLLMKVVRTPHRDAHTEITITWHRREEERHTRYQHRDDAERDADAYQTLTDDYHVQVVDEDASQP